MPEIIQKNDEEFFIYPIGSITERAIRDALDFLNLNSDMVEKKHASKGILPVFPAPVSFIENITENPTWGNRKFIIYHELDEEFCEWQPEKGIRRKAGKKGGEVFKMSALRVPARKIRRGKNV